MCGEEFWAGGAVWLGSGECPVGRCDELQDVRGGYEWGGESGQGRWGWGWEAGTRVGGGMWG